MKLKNVSARAYGINGKIYAPLQVFELTDEVAIASVQSIVESGDFEVIGENKSEDQSEDTPAKRGRPAKQKEAE